MNYQYSARVLNIPNATPETTDAAQFMFYMGRKQYNLCGEFCVAYCMQDEAHTDTIDDFLKYWEAHDPRWYRSLFRDKLARTTGVYDLRKMLDSYAAQYYPFSQIKTDPGLMALELEQAQAIVGVQIDRGGYLVGRGIPHWIVLEDITVIDPTHARVEVYNPYTNFIEPYSWREFMTSTGVYKNGLWIKRNR